MIGNKPFQTFKGNFEEFYRVSNPGVERYEGPPDLVELLETCGGRVYDKGLYSVYDFKQSRIWASELSVYFPHYNSQFLPFGHDWMGRQFCLSTAKANHIHIFDPGSFEDLYVEVSLYDFHNELLTADKHDFFASDLFEAGLSELRLSGVGSSQCLGLKIPLFLGGEDEPSNYSVSDLQVYWNIHYQLYKQTHGMPEGTVVNSVSIKIPPVQPDENS